MGESFILMEPVHDNNEMGHTAMNPIKDNDSSCREERIDGNITKSVNQERPLEIDFLVLCKLAHPSSDPPTEPLHFLEDDRTVNLTEATISSCFSIPDEYSDGAKDCDGCDYTELTPGSVGTTEEETSSLEEEEEEEALQGISFLREAYPEAKHLDDRIIASLSRPISTAITKTASAKSSPRRSVSFHEVQVREYHMTLSDNPSCSAGAPVGLDWTYQERPRKSLEEYETERLPRRRKQIRHLIMSYYKRQAILARLGYTATELWTAEQQVAKIQRQRSVTQNLLPLRKLEEMAQSAKRKIKRRIGGSGGSHNA